MELTRRAFGQTLGISAAGAAFLPLIGCGQSSITTDLQLVISGAEALLPFVPGLNGADAALITAALNGLSDAVAFATTELASTDSAAVKYSRIAAEFAKVALSSLAGSLSGAPAKVLTIIGNIATALANFLATIKVAPALATKAGVPVELTKGDLKALPKIRARAMALKAKLH